VPNSSHTTRIIALIEDADVVNRTMTIRQNPHSLQGIVSPD
jgi:hypothetical protein